MQDATCKRLLINPIIFYPIGRQVSQAPLAKKVCSICPVQSECLNYALDNGIKDGIWGGLTKTERKRLRRERILLTVDPLSLPQR